ncbi:Atrial natriuretic peptide receptor 1, partial [Lamellibrachia satsuma]
QGMRYIHRSGLKSHGNLKSYTCLIDSRWTVKVSFFGLHSLTSVATLDCAEDESKYAELLWTAPELLRICGVASPGGTDKGDVYSFGIMLQEILFRNTPFFYSNLSVNDVIRRVLAAETPPYRPDFPDDITNIGESCVVELMVRCWNESPEYRPSFDDILKTLLRMHRGRQVNILDNMLQKLEKYATNLEELVQHRTAELVEEKKKTDSLLYRMLPRSVAEKLKAGKIVEAEMYDSVTIYFSDIVGFTSLSSASSPMQVVSLLNDLYTLFDDTIQKYDVYKVETIGDAYLLVSGLPHRNGARHAAEVANTALSLLDEVCHFKIKHRPDHKLLLRIGLHTGSCAAGVVGLTMPRYCLFGDAVNMASRMESTGE